MQPFFFIRAQSSPTRLWSYFLASWLIFTFRAASNIFSTSRFLSGVNSMASLIPSLNGEFKILDSKTYVKSLSLLRKRHIHCSLFIGADQYCRIVDTGQVLDRIGRRHRKQSYFSLRIRGLLPKNFGNPTFWLGSGNGGTLFKHSSRPLPNHM